VALTIPDREAILRGSTIRRTASPSCAACSFASEWRKRVGLI